MFNFMLFCFTQFDSCFFLILTVAAYSMCTVAHNCHGNNKYLTAKPKVSRRNTIPHSKTKMLTAITNSSRQNQHAHGKTKKLTAKAKSSRQNQKLTAKAKSSRQKQKVHGKTKTRERGPGPGCSKAD